MHDLLELVSGALLLRIALNPFASLDKFVLALGVGTGGAHARGQYEFGVHD